MEDLKDTSVMVLHLTDKKKRMGPPKYGDLGKQASDVFGKGYHFGLLKLEVYVTILFSLRPAT